MGQNAPEDKEIVFCEKCGAPTTIDGIDAAIFKVYESKVPFLILCEKCGHQSGVNIGGKW